MPKPNRALSCAKEMLGNGWFTPHRLAEVMGFSVSEGSQAIQAIRRSSFYWCDEEHKNGVCLIRVIRVKGEYKPSHETKLWRLGIFGEGVAA